MTAAAPGRRNARTGRDDMPNRDDAEKFESAPGRRDARAGRDGGAGAESAP